MLQHRGDDMVPRIKDSLDGDIQGLRGIAGKYHLLGVLCVEELCQQASGLIHSSRCLEGCLMGASARIAHRLHGRNDRIDNALGLFHGCGRIVQIDHLFSSQASLAAPMAPVYLASGWDVRGLPMFFDTSSIK